MAMLVEHFDSDEFGRSLTASVLNNYYMLCVLLLSKVRDKFGRVHITSGFRTQEDQERLKKEGYAPSDTSQHLFGEACDFICPDAPNRMGEVYDFIVNELKWPGETIWYKKRGHMHVALPTFTVKADRYILEA